MREAYRPGTMRHTSADPAPVDPAVEMLDRRIGNLVVNRFTYRPLRALARLMRPRSVPSGVIARHTCGAVIVTPDIRHCPGALMLFHGGGFVLGHPADLLPKAAMFAKALGEPVICPAYPIHDKAGLLGTKTTPRFSAAIGSKPFKIRHSASLKSSRLKPASEEKA